VTRAARVRLAIVADTHLPRGRRRLPDRCVDELRRADLVLHAGDVSSAAALDEIEALGTPVVAVLGNVDEPALAARLPEERLVHAGGATIALVHDAGPSRGRLDRLRLRFPAADAVVFGHSHIPLYEERDGFQIFNPGSPTDRRRQPRHTMGLAEVADGRLSFRLVALD
jgi:putative phosphoesterase